MGKKENTKKIPKPEWEKKAQEAGETRDAGKSNKVWGRPTKQVRSDFGEGLRHNTARGRELQTERTDGTKPPQGA